MPSRKVKISAAVVLTFAILLTVGFGAVYAYLSAADSSTNTFAPAVVPRPEVEVSTIENTQTQKRTATGSLEVQADNCPLYVRVAVVINWINTKGEVCSSPVGATCDISIPDGWAQEDAFYYYTYVVEAGEGFTAEFVVEYSSPDEYEVQVKIISQTIQAIGSVGDTSAVKDAWGVDIDALKNQN